MKRLCCVAVFLVCAGCNADRRTVRVWGEVSYNGVPVEEGEIVWFPIDGTTGPSTGGPIRNGRYDIASDIGPIVGGKYQISITAQGAARTYSPNASGKGDRFEVRDQYIPPLFNRQTTLKVVVADSADKNQHDFHLIHPAGKK